MDLSNLLMIVVVMGAFWFLVIRPQQQRQRKHADMVAALNTGDEIVTIGGIFGTVVEVGERIRIRVADGTELEITPSAVGRVLPAGEGKQSFEGDREEPSAETDAPSDDEGIGT